MLFVVCCVCLLFVMDVLPFSIVLLVVGSCVLFAVRCALCGFVCVVSCVLSVGRCLLFIIGVV